MSNPYAIAGVTRVLQDILGEINDQVIPHIGQVQITAVAPDQILNNGANNELRLNCFLYRVTPNTGWINECWASHNGRGERLTNPPLPLNLHYLLSAYGVNDLQAEILLGWAMHLLHLHPVLSRERINDVIDPEGVPLQPPLTALPGSGLADQIEQIKVTPEYLSTEELSKLWTAVQSHYRPTVAYVATVVLIQAQEPTRTPLPVLTRGRPVEVESSPGEFRETGVLVQPFLIPPVPTIESLELPQDNPAIEVEQSLTIEGHHLNDENVLVRFRHPRLENPIELEDPPDATPTEIPITIDPTDGWISGMFQVQVILRHPSQTNPAIIEERLSNAVPMVLAPTFTVGEVTRGVDPDGVDIVTVQLTVSPRVVQGQSVSLIVGERESHAEPPEFTTGQNGEASTTQLSFVFRELPPNLDPGYPARLRVDGVESLLIRRPEPPQLPSFDPDRFIEVPA